MTPRSTPLKIWQFFEVVFLPFTVSSTALTTLLLTFSNVQHDPHHLTSDLLQCKTFPRPVSTIFPTTFTNLLTIPSP